MAGKEKEYPCKQAAVFTQSQAVNVHGAAAEQANVLQIVCSLVFPPQTNPFCVFSRRRQRHWTGHPKDHQKRHSTSGIHSHDTVNKAAPTPLASAPRT